MGCSSWLRKEKLKAQKDRQEVGRRGVLILGEKEKGLVGERQ